MSAAQPAVVGIDLGGTKLAAVLVDGQGTVRHRVWREHRATDYPSALASVRAAVHECAQAANAPTDQASPTAGHESPPATNDRTSPPAAAGTPSLPPTGRTSPPATDRTPSPPPTAGGPVMRVAAVGLAVAGPLDRDRERVLAALNLGFAGQPMRHDLAERLGVPVVLENDANAAALAEHRWGPARALAAWSC